MKKTAVILFLIFVEVSVVLAQQVVEASSFSMAIKKGLLLPNEKAKDTAQHILIKNDIICDVDYAFGEGSDIQIAPNVQITITQGAELILNNTDVSGCEQLQLWRSITVNKGARLDIVNGTTIQDGLYAVEILHDNTTTAAATAVAIRNSTFRKNYAAIYTPPAPSPNLSRLLLQQVAFEGGALKPSLGHSVAGNWAYAGFLLNDFANLTFVVGLSTFDSLANGIVAYRSNININRAAVFRNILPRGYGIDGNGVFTRNDTSSQYSISVNGFGQTGAATFNNCRNGIISTAAHLTVTNNNMTNMQGICIESRLAHLRRINISQNQISLFSNWNGIGINLLQNDGSPSILVSNNTLNVGQTLWGAGMMNIAGGGIIVNEQLVTHPVNILQNTILLFRASAGISLTSNFGARVLVNTVDFREPFPVLGFLITVPRTGIALNGCQGITMGCNNILSNWNNTTPILPNTTGIRISDTRVTADCNSMARTFTGMLINGSSCAGSSIRGNSFFRNQIGLYYTATAITSPQSYAGNRWLGAWGGNRYGAQHDGASVDIQNSGYTVMPNNMPPNIWTPNNTQNFSWFDQITQIPNPTYSCLNNPCLPSPAITPLALNSVDIAIVNNQIPQNPTAIPWELRRGLYNKLDKNPSFQNISVMGQFYNTYQNQTIGTVVATADERESTMLIDTTDAVVLEQHRTIHETIIDSLGKLDSLYLVGGLNNTNWNTQRHQWLQQWLQNDNASSSLCNGLFGICQAQSQQAQALNSTIIYTNTPEENEQLVNDIYLQTVALGSDDFDTIQIQTLYNIAHQCPELGGVAVYRARSIYALIGYDTYDDNCDNLPQARMSNLSSPDTCYSEVKFMNPSLEGIPGFGNIPAQWNICKQTPDVQPSNLTFPPSHGNTYVDIVSSPLTFFQESFGQKLADTLRTNMKYRFLVDLAIPGQGLSCDLLIWIGDSLCHKDQLISNIVSYDTVWYSHLVDFMPNSDYAYIMFEANYISNNFILIDNLRSIPQPFGCDTVSVINSLLPDKTDNTGDGVYTNVTTTELSSFNIYPNPNIQGLLTIEWTATIPTEQIVIVDALGRVVGDFEVANNLTTNELDIKNLPSGSYVVLLKNGEEILGRKKLIVMKE